MFVRLLSLRVGQIIHTACLWVHTAFIPKADTYVPHIIISETQVVPI